MADSLANLAMDTATSSQVFHPSARCGHADIHAHLSNDIRPWMAASIGRFVDFSFSSNALGCDRVINYNKEDSATVLKTEYPKGVDLVFETVGGETFKSAVQNIAVRGRVIVFGSISGYLEDHKAAEPLLSTQVNATLLDRASSVRGFNVSKFADRILANLAKLLQLIDEGKLKPGVDKTEFRVLEGIADAVEYMFARKNVGKLAIKLV